jgi:hypothetical protein
MLIGLSSKIGERFMMNIGERSKRMRKMELCITADKREIKDFPKLPLATSFIRKPLYAIQKIFF